MKCYYYLSPTLESTEAISGDLQNSGVSDWFVHIVSKDEAGLSKRHLHSSNYLETMDLIRDGLIGGIVGFLLGLLFAAVIAMTQPFGPDTHILAYLGVIVLLTGFGAWQGGLVGISTENKKLQHFHKEIEAGQYLILVYAGKNEEQKVADMMSRLHPEARLVGFDSKFYNPFASPTLNYK